MKVKLALLSILAFIPGKEFVTARLLKSDYPIFQAINKGLRDQKSPCAIKYVPNDPCNSDSWVAGSGYSVIECEDGKVTIVNLTKCRLQRIPPAVFDLLTLKTLDVYDNQIKGSLTINDHMSLGGLFLSSNYKLESVNLKNLPTLAYIDLSDSQRLKSLTLSGKFTSLDRVDARGTALQAGSVTCTDVESPLFELLIDACPDLYVYPDGPFNIYVNCNVATCPTDAD